MSTRRKVRIVGLVLMMICVSLAGCRKEPEAADPSGDDNTNSGENRVIGEENNPSGAVEGVVDPPEETANTITIAPIEPVTAQVHVLLETSKGDILLELDPDAAPVTVTNFVQYVSDGFYDGTVFHRVMPGFMIQGGGYTPNMAEKPTRSQILNEAANGLKNGKGTIAMARTPMPHSATSQFFINHKDNPMLNYGTPGNADGYAVFGKVVQGMDVVDAIAGVPTRFNAEGEKSEPIEPILLKKAKVISTG